MLTIVEKNHFHISEACKSSRRPDDLILLDFASAIIIGGRSQGKNLENQQPLMYTTLIKTRLENCSKLPAICPILEEEIARHCRCVFTFVECFCLPAGGATTIGCLETGVGSHGGGASTATAVTVSLANFANAAVHQAFPLHPS